MFMCTGCECKAKALSLCPCETMKFSKCMNMSVKQKRTLKKEKYWMVISRVVCVSWMRRSEVEY